MDSSEWPELSDCPKLPKVPDPTRSNWKESAIAKTASERLLGSIRPAVTIQSNAGRPMTAKETFTKNQNGKEKATTSHSKADKPKRQQYKTGMKMFANHSESKKPGSIVDKFGFETTAYGAQAKVTLREVDIPAKPLSVKGNLFAALQDDEPLSIEKLTKVDSDSDSDSRPDEEDELLLGLDSLLSKAGDNFYNQKISLIRNLAKKFFAASRFSEAISLYSKGITICPNESELAILYSNRSVCYFQCFKKSSGSDRKKHLKAAIEDAMSVVRHDTHNVKGYQQIVKIATEDVKGEVISCQDVYNAVVSGCRAMPADSTMKTLIVMAEKLRARSLLCHDISISDKDLGDSVRKLLCYGQPVVVLQEALTETGLVIRAGSTAFVYSVDDNINFCHIMLKFETNHVTQYAAILCSNLRRLFYPGDLVSVLVTKGHFELGEIVDVLGHDRYSVMIKKKKKSEKPTVVAVPNFQLIQVFWSVPGARINDQPKTFPRQNSHVVLNKCSQSGVVVAVASNKDVCPRDIYLIALSNQKCEIFFRDEFFNPQKKQKTPKAMKVEKAEISEKTEKTEAFEEPMINTSSVPEKQETPVTTLAKPALLDDSILEWHRALPSGSLDADTTSIQKVVTSGCSFAVAQTLVRDLVDRGADLNTGTGKLLDTPLHEAARRNDFDLAMFLLELGALPSRLNAKSHLPEALATLEALQLALKKSREELKAQKLKERKSKKKKEMQEKVVTGCAPNTLSAVEIGIKVEGEVIVTVPEIASDAEDCKPKSLEDLVNESIAFYRVINRPDRTLKAEQTSLKAAAAATRGLDPSTDHEPSHEASAAAAVCDVEDDGDDVLVEQAAAQGKAIAEVSDCDSRDDADTLWELEITKEACKQLKGLDPMLRRMFNAKVDELARGRWSSKIKRSTSHVQGLNLFRANFGQGSRILWEKAISFSSKKKCYLEVVRIWAVVADHDKQNEMIKRVEDSHRKGQMSNLRKTMKFRYSQTSSDAAGLIGVRDEDGILLTLPQQFDVISESYAAPSAASASERSTGHEKSCAEDSADQPADWYPPAVPSADAYVLLKFYECSKSLLRLYCAELDETHNTSDFPFRLSPLEQEICDIQPSPESSLVLLGRSGTGKTTCLGFRMWAHYKAWFDIFSKSDPVLSGGYSDTNTHLNQVFLTANPVLRTEVRKFFNCLLNGECGGTAAPRVQRKLDCGLDNPTLIDVPTEEFPLFLTKREWLVLLDGTLERPFFERLSNGSCDLAPGSALHAWGRTETSGLFNLLDSLDDDEDDELGDDDGRVSMDKPARKAREKTGPGDDAQTGVFEVDYDYFAAKVWSQLDPKEQFSPALLWCEFTSFIKGSAETLELGPLTEKQYSEIGKKRAPNFKHSRSDIYAMYLQYERIKRRLGGYDLCDLVRHILQELRRQAAGGNIKTGYRGSPLHEIFVDEIQDFMECEIVLMIAVADPNKLFLTGDDAQTIARGLSFRFRDVISIFHNLHAKDPSIGVPETRTLTNNFRTHSGILNLANTVIEIMKTLFPGSVEKVAHDRGLFDGPKPWILKAAKFEDLCVLLLGSDSESQIEFGAQQCVIVRDAQSKMKIPTELKQGGIVCSVFESKGLEFNDVLLYNFFTDSPAKQMWRCVLSLIDDLQTFTNRSEEVYDSGVRVVDLNDGNDAEEADRKARKKSGFLRDLQFNEAKHKILLDELRHLYTAVTRARVNIWIYDESEEFRAPMFELFEAKGLVRAVISILDLDELKITKGALTSQEEWIAQGKNLFDKGAFQLAQTCFSKGQNTRLSAIAQANYLARSPHFSGESQQDTLARYAAAAECFLAGYSEESQECLAEAAYCLRKSGNFRLAFDLYETLGKTKSSARCLEELGQFIQAGEIYLSCGQTQSALRCLTSKNQRDHTQAAEVLVKFGLVDDAVFLLRKHKHFGEAYLLLEQMNDPNDDPAVSRNHANRLDDMAIHQAREVVLRGGANTMETSVSWLNLVSPAAFNRVERMFRNDKSLLEVLVQFMIFKGKHMEAVGLLCEKKLHKQAVDLLGTVESSDVTRKLTIRCLLASKDILSSDDFEIMTRAASGDPFLMGMIGLKEAALMSFDAPGSEAVTAKLHTILSSFLETKHAWGIIWTFKTAVDIFGSGYLDKLFPTDSIKNVNDLNDSLELIIGCVNGCMGGKNRQATDSFFEFSLSIMKPTYLKYDILAIRMLWVVKGSGQSEKESTLNNYDFCFPSREFGQLVKHKVVEMIWKWDIVSYIQSIDVNLPVQGYETAVRSSLLIQLFKRIQASVIDLPEIDKQVLNIGATLATLKYEISPVLARSVEQVVKFYRQQPFTVIPFRDGSFALTEAWVEILSDYMSEEGIGYKALQASIRNVDSVDNISSLIIDACLFLEITSPTIRPSIEKFLQAISSWAVDNVKSLGREFSTTVAAKIRLIFASIPIASPVKVKSTKYPILRAMLKNMELVTEDWQSKSFRKLHSENLFTIPILEEGLMMSLVHVSIICNSRFVLPISAAITHFGSPVTWSHEANVDQSIYVGVRNPGEFLSEIKGKAKRTSLLSHFLEMAAARAKRSKELSPRWVKLVDDSTAVLDGYLKLIIGSLSAFLSRIEQHTDGSGVVKEDQESLESIFTVCLVLIKLVFVVSLNVLSVRKRAVETEYWIRFVGAFTSAWDRLSSVISLLNNRGKELKISLWSDDMYLFIFQSCSRLNNMISVAHVDSEMKLKSAMITFYANDKNPLLHFDVFGRLLQRYSIARRSPRLAGNLVSSPQPNRSNERAVVTIQKRVRGFLSRSRVKKTAAAMVSNTGKIDRTNRLLEVKPLLLTDDMGVFLVNENGLSHRDLYWQLYNTVFNALFRAIDIYNFSMEWLHNPVVFMYPILNLVDAEGAANPYSDYELRYSELQAWADSAAIALADIVWLKTTTLFCLSRMIDDFDRRFKLDNMDNKVQPKYYEASYFNAETLATIDRSLMKFMNSLSTCIYSGGFRSIRDDNTSFPELSEQWRKEISTTAFKVYSELKGVLDSVVVDVELETLPGGEEAETKAKATGTDGLDDDNDDEDAGFVKVRIGRGNRKKNKPDKPVISQQNTPSSGNTARDLKSHGNGPNSGRGDFDRAGRGRGRGKGGRSVR